MTAHPLNTEALASLYGARRAGNPVLFNQGLLIGPCIACLQLSLWITGHWALRGPLVWSRHTTPSCHDLHQHTYCCQSSLVGMRMIIKERTNVQFYLGPPFDTCTDICSKRWLLNRWQSVWISTALEGLRYPNSGPYDSSNL